MRAIQFRDFGGPEVLHLAEVEIPKPGPKECLVRIHAAGINPLEHKIRGGKMRLIFPIERPHIPGTDICGTLESLGSKVEHLEAGSWVIGKLNPRKGGAYAEFATLPADSLFAKPESLSPEEGAALPVAGLTALQGLRDRGKMRPGQRILINGASGGVGHLASQIAVAIGAQVTAVCGPDNVAWVKDLGVDQVIDYRQQDFSRSGQKYDLIFDTVASRSFMECARALSRGGVYVTTVPSLGLLLSGLIFPLVFGKYGRAVMVKAKASDFALLYDLAERGQLRPRIQQVFPLREAPAAQAASAAGKVAGKLILGIRPAPAESPPDRQASELQSLPDG